MKQMEFHMKRDGKWVPFSMESCTGKPTREEVWLGMEGKEIVIKLTSGGAVYFIAGTEELRKYYEGKGHRTFSFPQAVEMMQKVDSPFFDQAWIDCYCMAMAAFPGISLQKIEDTREEEKDVANQK